MILNFSFFLLLFFSTLQCYYFYQIKLAPFPMLGVLIFISVFIIQALKIFHISNKQFISKDKINQITCGNINEEFIPNYNNNVFPSFKTKPFICFFVLFTLTSISTIITFFHTGFNFYLNPENGIYLNPIIGFFCGTIIAFLIFTSEIKTKIILNIVRIVLLIHLLFFCFQLLIYYSSHTYVDFLMPFTGENQRYFSYAIAPFIRPTGLFNEPATYSFFISSLTIILIAERERKTDDFLILIAIFTVLASFSSLAYLSAFYLIISYILKANKIRFLGILVSVFFLAIFVALFLPQGRFTHSIFYRAAQSDFICILT